MEIVIAVFEKIASLGPIEGPLFFGITMLIFAGYRHTTDKLLNAE
jgi:hypothetical protein